MSGTSKVQHQGPPLSVAIAGEVYSDNLGDPLLCYSLKELILHVAPDVRITFVDISGKRPPIANNSMSEHRSNFTLLRSLIPKRFQEDVSWYIRRKSLSGSFKKDIADVDAVIVAGGQLLMDNMLYFPRRLSLLLEAAENQGKPVIFWACGAYTNWSMKGVRRLLPWLNSPNVLQVGVRDRESVHYLKSLFAVEAVVNMDPALISLAKKRGIDSSGNEISVCPRRIAINVMSPAKAAVNRPYDAAAIHQTYINLLSTMAKHNVVVFSNGEQADYEYQCFLRSQLSPALRTKIQWHDRIRDHEEFVRVIDGADTLYCSRLHAAISGWALSKSVWVLNGDVKIENLMSSIGVHVLASKKMHGELSFVKTQWVDSQDLIEESLSRLRTMLTSLNERRQTIDKLENLRS